MEMPVEPKASDGKPVIKADPEKDRVLLVGSFFEWQIFIPKFKVWYTWLVRSTREELDTAAKEIYHTDICELAVFQMSAEDFKNLIDGAEGGKEKLGE